MFVAIHKTLLGSLKIIERPDERPEVVWIDATKAIRSLMLYRENLVADDAIAANPLLVCLCVFHDPIIYGYELMYTASDGGCRFFYSGLEGGLRDLREVDAHSP
jgi:hypothetical protein